MSYVFSFSERDNILLAASMCKGMHYDTNSQQYKSIALVGQHCAPLYEMLSDIVGEKLSDSIVANEGDQEALKSAKLWLDVAKDANGGRGAYSALIRAYTKRQGQLRLNRVFSDELIQNSSNQVAVNFINTLMYGALKDNLAPWTVPSIGQIASIDASAIGEILFPHEVGVEDTASSRNSAWSGTIAFSLLGGEYPFETWRLISAGDPESEVKGNHEQAKVNRIDDFKNILFAINSYSVALESVVKNFGSNIFETLFSVLPEQINVALSSGNVNPLVQYVVKGTPISPTIDIILRYGVSVFFDMFRRTYEGGVNVVPTTEETFASNAYAFFSSISPSQSNSVLARTIGEYGGVYEWGEKAAHDTLVGRSLRNSLKYLSEIVIERSDGFSGRGLELYDPNTGDGVLTKQWLSHRADMLGRAIARTNGSFGGNTAQKFSYSDLASGKQLPMTTGVSNPLVMFGDDGGRSFSGGANIDCLYGGANNDTINGLGGNDYIEGGHGNDSITGGDGNDELHGMSGDDVLVGGKGNDILIGGVGYDQYEFSSGDGVDQIFDVDADGKILINGLPIPVAFRSGPLSNTWTTEDESIILTLVEESDEQTLSIKYGQNDSILIKNYTPGMLGIHLPGYESQPFSTPDLVFVGDKQAVDTDPNVPGEQLSYDEFGNVVVIPDVIEINRADVLHGAAYDDEIIGLGGSDRLFGKAGNDRLFGNQQTTIEQALADKALGSIDRGDWLDGGQGNDLLIGTSARDVLLGGNGRDTLIGGAGDDNLSGDDLSGSLAENWNFERIDVPLSSGVISSRNVYVNAGLINSMEGDNDVLYGQGGQDFITGGWGDDLLDGGTDDDILSGDGGNDTLRGGDDNDILLGDNLDWPGGLESKHHGNDLLDGGDGNDVLAGNGGSDVLYGGRGNDYLTGDDSISLGVEGDAAHYFGNDFLDGGAGDDTLQGGGADDSLYGGTGNDDLSGDYADHPLHYHGNDFLDGGIGNDTLRGMGGSDTLIGGEGADALDGDDHGLKAGGTNDDYIEGNAGNDTLWGGLGADTLYGGADDDFLIGDYEHTPEVEHGADYLDGGEGNDTLLGGGGDDTLNGGAGEDYLRGGSGNNVFAGGSGNDYLEGQDGNDTFYFGAGDGTDVIRDAGGNNIIKFGSGFTTSDLKAGFIVIDVGPVLRLSNGFGDAVLIRDFENWKNSSFSFNDGTIWNFEDVMKIVEGTTDGRDSLSAEGTISDVIRGNDESSDHSMLEEQSDSNREFNGLDHFNDVLKDAQNKEDGGDNRWVKEFLVKIKERRTALGLAAGLLLNDKGNWVRAIKTDSESKYEEQTSIVDENFQVGSLSENPKWMSAVSGRAVYTERSSATTSRVGSRAVATGGVNNIEKKELHYYPSGSSYSGFSFNAGDVVVEDKSTSGVVKGWYVYPAGSFGSGGIRQKEFSWELTTETIKHQIVQGDHAGGRVNLEAGNIFHGGMGDDLIVTFIDPSVYYGDRVAGAFLSGGAGNDTLLGSEGADYLISGPGDDWLYGENGPDTYVIGAHAGATTVIVDMLHPVFLRPEVGGSGWQSEFGALDEDTIVLPDEVSAEQLRLSWGSLLVEAVNTESAPDPKRGTHRNSPRCQMLYSTLNVAFGKDQKVRIVMPNPSDLSGSGIEFIKFSDGSRISVERLIENSKLGSAPDTYHHGIQIDNAALIRSHRDNATLPLVGSRGDDTLSGAGEIRGMQGDDFIFGSVGDDVLLGGLGDDTLTGGAGNDVYKYDGLGKDLIVNNGGGNDGVDFSDFDISIDQLKFHRDDDDLVIVVNYGVSPKIRVSNHFSKVDAAISYIRVRGEGRATQDYTADQIVEFLHPLPPLRDVEDILLLNDESSLQAMLEIIEFYGLNGS